MAAGEPPETSDPFDERIDFEESLDRLKHEDERGPLVRATAWLRSFFR